MRLIQHITVEIVREAGIISRCLSRPSSSTCLATGSPSASMGTHGPTCILTWPSSTHYPIPDPAPASTQIHIARYLVRGSRIRRQQCRKKHVQKNVSLSMFQMMVLGVRRGCKHVTPAMSFFFFFFFFVVVGARLYRTRPCRDKPRQNNVILFICVCGQPGLKA
jgi:hypothetical protein